MSSDQWNRYYRIWVNHSIFYNFSVNIPLVFHQAYAIRVLGYGVEELGTLAFINLAFLALGNLIAPVLLYRYRDRRVVVWKIFTSTNLISWSLTGFSDMVLNRYALYVFVAIAQLSGAIGAMAYSDTIADMIPKEESVKIFSRVNTLYMSSALVALVVSIALFSVVGPTLLSYRICYTASLTTALISAALLLMMRDLARRSPDMVNLNTLIKGYHSVVNDGRIKSYVVFITIFTFSVNLPGALWNYYIINVFKGSETWISINTIASTLALSLGSFVLSKFYHRLEPKRVLVTSTIPISLFPILFLAANTMVYQALANMFSGFSWSAFNLITGIYNLYIAREQERIYLLSMIGIASNLAAAVSSKLGALIASVSLIAMQSVFIASFAGRLLMYLYGRRRLPSV